LVENDATPLVFVVEVRSASIACQDWFSRKHSTVTPDTGLPLESVMVTLQDAVAPFAMFCPLIVMAAMWTAGLNEVCATGVAFDCVEYVPVYSAATMSNAPPFGMGFPK